MRWVYRLIDTWLDGPETRLPPGGQAAAPDAGVDPEAFRRLGEARPIVEAHT